MCCASSGTRVLARQSTRQPHIGGTAHAGTQTQCAHRTHTHTHTHIRDMRTRTRTERTHAKHTHIHKLRRIHTRRLRRRSCACAAHTFSKYDVAKGATTYLEPCCVLCARWRAAVGVYVCLCACCCCDFCSGNGDGGAFGANVLYCVFFAAVRSAACVGFFSSSLTSSLVGRRASHTRFNYNSRTRRVCAGGGGGKLATKLDALSSATMKFHARWRWRWR